jgi:hypothetical protein
MNANRYLRAVPALMLLLPMLSGCAARGAGAPQPGTAAAVSAPQLHPALERFGALRVPETRAFAAAVERGTRTRDGTPGRAYWQQWARYRISAELLPQSNRLEAQGQITYINRSPGALPELFIHLHQNLYARGAPRNEPVPVTEGMKLRRVSVGGRAVEAVDLSDTGRSGYEIEATTMRLRLPTPLAPGDSVLLELSWAFAIPPDGAPRQGTDGETHMIAYWYPQLAVYDDVTGWHTDPYLGNAEFYMGYGDYDVALTVPAGYLVGATGTLVNESEVLTQQTRERLAEARQSGRIVTIVGDTDRRPGRSTQQGAAGKLTWRWRADGVRDFAFAASDHYLWDAAAARVGDADGDGRPDTAMVHALYRPSRRQWAWDRAAEFGRHSIEFLSGFLWPYPYPQSTAIDGVRSCSGMEYPMITCIGGPRDSVSLYSVTVHELAHFWFPMRVGSDEKRHSWQDEGLTRFNQNQAMRDFFRGMDRSEVARNNYLSIAGGDVERPLMTHGDLYPMGTRAFVVASYEKMATNMEMLRALLGEETFMRAYREYGRRWENRHPTPFDFFNTIESVAGRELGWFWRAWWFETWTLDHRIASVTSRGGETRIVIEDRGMAPMPARLIATTEDGVRHEAEVPVDSWFSGERHGTAVIRSKSPVVRVELDPQRRFAYVTRDGHVWTR